MGRENVEIFPNNINIHSNLYLNPNSVQGSSDFIYPEFPIKASLSLDVPLSFIANNLIFTETVNADLSSNNELILWV